MSVRVWKGALAGNLVVNQGESLRACFRAMVALLSCLGVAVKPSSSAVLPRLLSLTCSAKMHCKRKLMDEQN